MYTPKFTTFYKTKRHQHLYGMTYIALFLFTTKRLKYNLFKKSNRRTQLIYKKEKYK